MTDFSDARGEDLREFVEALLRYDTTDGNEAPAQEWLEGRLSDLGFQTYRWTADEERLAAHPSFPDDCSEFDLDDRPSVGGVLEFGDPEAGRTLVLNGHCDVVPAETETWTSDPFEPTWHEDDLVARGAADMKSGLSACVFTALHLAETAEGLDGRVVVESVAGEEEGGIGAAAAALSNPYPFERDAAIIMEPTELTPVVACEGSLMKRLRLRGRSAHAATTWNGESVLPHFERIRQAFAELEEERHDRITHPLYERFPSKVPVNCGRMEAGSWASSVPASLEAEFRIGVAPVETVEEVEDEFDARLAEVVAESPWLTEHLPEFERFSVQFEPSAVDPTEPVVRAVQDAMAARALHDRDARGVTYGADARHYVAAGIPTVLFGPGSIEQAHFPDETIHWPDVLEAGAVVADAAERYLSS
jgi:acetylornithine deacetylase